MKQLRKLACRSPRHRFMEFAVPRARNATIVFLTGLLLAGCRRGGAPGSGTPEELVQIQGDRSVVPAGSPLRDRLNVREVSTESLRRQLVVPSTVEALPDASARIHPPLSGRVVRLDARFGDTVEKGSPLLELESPDLSTAEADLEKSRATLLLARRNFERQKDLLEHGVGSQRDFDQSQSDLETATSEQQRATTRLQQLGVDASKLSGTLVVRSPVSGRVIAVNTAPGQYQNDPTADVMIVADLSRVWVTASVQEKDIRRLKVGDEATITFPAYPGETFHSKIDRLGDLLDPDTRTIKIHLSLDNPGARLKPGMFGTVAFQSDSSPEVVVPATALVVRGDETLVFVETSPWTFERRTVETGEQIGDRVVITRGLKPGSRIVTLNAVVMP
ncbi:MAG TPA: efflux RND transporter periplasmic adaptor subunit [Thermoanaerobaculia bacterium]|nr:efflux RND transporter periplasmic adaptor subunit [Thermoanaerobaculia bacterium]